MTFILPCRYPTKPMNSSPNIDTIMNGNSTYERSLLPVVLFRSGQVS